MIHLSDTIHFEQTRIYQQPVDMKKYVLKVEFLLLLLFLFCSACANSPGQPSAMQDQQRNAQSDSSFASGAAVEANTESTSEPATCARQTYPTYVDVVNQKIVASDIQSGSAQVILHFHKLGQETLDAFLSRNTGVLEVDSQWPDWGAISITVNESGLRQLSEDCAIRVIEANKREYPL